MSDSKVPHYSNWVDGSHASPSHTKLCVDNPTTGDFIATIDSTSQDEVARIIQRSWNNFNKDTWSKADASERFSVLSKAATLLRARIPEFGELEVQQTGRPIREMRAQLARIPEWLEYFASLARLHEGAVTPFKGPVVNTLVRTTARCRRANHTLESSVADQYQKDRRGPGCRQGGYRQTI